MSKPNYPQKLIVILGPTASGKSDLAVKLARQFNGEIISADSRQVYRGMNLGTGKITQKEMAGIPHHLLDVAPPRRRFTVAQYKKLAQAAIKKIQAKGKIPIICGGTGFYIQALVDDLKIPAVKPNLAFRAQLEKITTKDLYKSLQKMDPVRAKNIDQHNRRRLIRAIEIVKMTGQPVPPLKSPSSSLRISEPNGLTPPKGGGLPPFREGWGGFNTLFLGIQKSPANLTQRIKIRLQKRLKQGMIKEVKTLRQQGLSWKKLDDFGLEYRWISRYLQNKIGYEEMVKRLQKDIEHYAKRQMTWFKRDKRIHWIKNYSQTEKIIKNFLK